jgi:hypothetical protein
MEAGRPWSGELEQADDIRFLVPAIADKRDFMPTSEVATIAGTLNEGKAPAGGLSPLIPLYCLVWDSR